MKSICVFPDTEFTDFANMDLISIGAVVEHGDQEFYREVSDHRDYLRSGFVQQHVMCHTDLRNFGAPKKQVADEWATWIDSLPCDEVRFVIDYVGDWQLIDSLHKLVYPQKHITVSMYNAYLGDRLIAAIGKDSMTDYLNCWNDCCSIMETEFAKEGIRRHHALDDAKINKIAFVQALQNARNR